MKRVNEWKKHLTSNQLSLISQHYNDEEVADILQIYGKDMLGVLLTLFSTSMSQYHLAAHFSDVPTGRTGMLFILYYESHPSNHNPKLNV